MFCLCSMLSYTITPFLLLRQEPFVMKFSPFFNQFYCLDSTILYAELCTKYWYNGKALGLCLGGDGFNIGVVTGCFVLYFSCFSYGCQRKCRDVFKYATARLLPNPYAVTIHEPLSISFDDICLQHFKQYLKTRSQQLI
jgi:hypothetical protein